MSDEVRARFVVSGRVQGVAFRQFTVDEARRLGARGWVRNLDDGRVEGEAEGAREAVEALLRAVRRGPPAAQVAELEVTWAEPAGHGPFSIRF
jgi:acylphosphatase